MPMMDNSNYNNYYYMINLRSPATIICCHRLRMFIFIVALLSGSIIIKSNVQAKVINSEDPLFNEDELAELEQIGPRSLASSEFDGNQLVSRARSFPPEFEPTSYESHQWRHRLLTKRSVPQPPLPQPPVSSISGPLDGSNDGGARSVPPLMPFIPNGPALDPAKSSTGSPIFNTNAIDQENNNRKKQGIQSESSERGQVTTGGGDSPRPTSSNNRKQSMSSNKKNNNKDKHQHEEEHEEHDDESSSRGMPLINTAEEKGTPADSKERGLFDFKLNPEDDPENGKFSGKQINHQIVKLNSRPSKAKTSRSSSGGGLGSLGLGGFGSIGGSSGQNSPAKRPKKPTWNVYKALLGSISIISVLGVVSDLSTSFAQSRGADMLQGFVSKMVELMVEFMGRVFGVKNVSEGPGKIFTDMLSGALLKEVTKS